METKGSGRDGYYEVITRFSISKFYAAFVIFSNNDVVEIINVTQLSYDR